VRHTRAAAPAFARCCLLVILVSVVPGLGAWQWPVSQPRITGTFGQDVGGYLLRGVQLGGERQPVRPVDAGIVVASHADRRGADRAGTTFLSGLGSYVVIDHHRSFRSIYAHLETDEHLPAIGRMVDVDTRIGTMGTSGQIPARGLRLYVIDLTNGEYVNPFLLLPNVPDRAPPRIGAIYARRDGALYDLRVVRNLPPGQYDVAAEVTDRFATTAGSAVVAPYSVRFVVSGQEVFRLRSDRMSVHADGTRIEPGAIRHADLYDADGLIRLGSFSIGSQPASLEISVRDFAGAEVSWRATVAGAADEDVQ
jgi:hypothetical protein